VFRSPLPHRAMSYAIEIADLHVRRGGRDVLPGISLSIPAGQITGLLGPSGCGKTTLMRAIVGAQVVESGRVVVLGAAAGRPEQRRRVAYVPQEPSIYADLTVRENLSYFARILDVPGDRIEAVATLVDLAGRLQSRAGSLSGGERARVSLAVALLGKPTLLVLDEPTVGLDPLLRRQLWRTFHELATAGATLLISSHVMDEAKRCDHLVLMRDGQIVASDSPKAIRAQTGTGDLEEAFIALASRQ
jgi:ABC-2 type transport system ATP-binding protein